MPLARNSHNNFLPIYLWGKNKLINRHLQQCYEMLVKAKGFNTVSLCKNTKAETDIDHKEKVGHSLF